VARGRRRPRRRRDVSTRVTIGGETLAVEIVRASGDEIEARVGDAAYRMTIRRDGEDWHASLAGRTLALVVVRDRDRVWIAVDGEVYRCAVADEVGGEAAAAVRSPQVTAPMPGKVLRVLVETGGRVAAGDPLVILEAMKMETVATAEAAGRVAAVHVAPGAMVEPGETLVELEYEG
jgi:acetyl-CoA/propionyl-CoA carboxylase biotin carboxyl carrier protein